MKPNEFLPERTFQWSRFVYLVVNGRELAGEGTLTFPNLLLGNYLDEVERLEADLPEQVSIPVKKNWRAHAFLTERNSSFDPNSIKFSVLFELQILKRFKVKVAPQIKEICLNWSGVCYRQTGLIGLLKRRTEFEGRGFGVTYPRANTKGNPIYLGNILGGVQTFKNDSIRVNLFLLSIFYGFPFFNSKLHLPKQKCFIVSERDAALVLPSIGRPHPGPNGR
jgi:hypothetical protein